MSRHLASVRDPAFLTAAVPGVRVLLVDDNPGFLETLSGLLVEEGFDVRSRNDGLSALTAIDETRPDVVLMDVRMPGMDGIETTRRIKERYPDVGIVALTGAENQRAVREMLTAGASGYILKDSDGDEIVTAVREAATGGGLISPSVTPAVIDELAEALARERARARELEQARGALIERAAQRRELIARLGHEIRTPVTVILGTAETLRQGHVSEDERDELLENLADRARKLAELVGRFEAVVDTEMVDRTDLIAAVRTVAARDERVEVIAPDGPIEGPIERVAVERILTELIDNALSFSPAEATVTVEVTRGPGGPAVRVRDHGPGIAPGVLDRIFEPLEQAEDLNTRAHPGVGLGLPIARTSARAMGGDVTVESTGTEGTVFLWSLAPIDPPGTSLG